MTTTTSLYHPMPVHAAHYEARMPFAGFPQISHDRHFQPDPSPSTHDSPLLLPAQHLAQASRSMSVGPVPGGVNPLGPPIQLDTGAYSQQYSTQRYSSPAAFTQSVYSGSAYSTPIQQHQLIRQHPQTWSMMQPAMARTVTDGFAVGSMRNFAIAPSMVSYSPAQRYASPFVTPDAYVYQGSDGEQPVLGYMESPEQAGSRGKKHICVVCDKRFSRPSSLTTHMSVHTGAKPFVCTFDGCGRRFSVSSNLRRHVRIHEGMIPRTSPLSSATTSKSQSSTHAAHFHPYHQPLSETALPVHPHYAALLPSLSPEGPALDLAQYAIITHTESPCRAYHDQAAYQPFAAASSDMIRQQSAESTDSGSTAMRNDPTTTTDMTQPTTPGTPPHLALPHDNIYDDSYKRYI